MALVEQVKTAPAGTDTGVEGKDIPRGYVEMTFVKETATGRGRNELFIMEDMKNGTVKLTEGRVGITVGRYKPRVSYRPAGDWDRIYLSKVSRGYLATKTKKMDKVVVHKGKSMHGQDGTEYAPIDDGKVQAFVEELGRYAKKVFDASYTVRVDNISDEMIALGEKIVKELASGYSSMSLAEFNNKIKALVCGYPEKDG